MAHKTFKTSVFVFMESCLQSSKRLGPYITYLAVFLIIVGLCPEARFPMISTSKMLTKWSYPDLIVIFKWWAVNSSLDKSSPTVWSDFGKVFSTTSSKFSNFIELLLSTKISFTKKFKGKKILNVLSNSYSAIRIRARNDDCSKKDIFFCHLILRLHKKM